jgi:hypothetical protein
MMATLTLAGSAIPPGFLFAIVGDARIRRRRLRLAWRCRWVRHAAATWPSRAQAPARAGGACPTTNGSAALCRLLANSAWPTPIQKLGTHLHLEMKRVAASSSTADLLPALALISYDECGGPFRYRKAPSREYSSKRPFGFLDVIGAYLAGTLCLTRWADLNPGSITFAHQDVCGCDGFERW